MSDKDLVKSLRRKVSRFWREGHISRDARDVAYKVLDSSIASAMDEETLLWLLHRAISFPVSFAVVKDGLKIM